MAPELTASIHGRNFLNNCGGQYSPIITFQTVGQSERACTHIVCAQSNNCKKSLQALVRLSSQQTFDRPLASLHKFTAEKLLEN